MIDYDRSWMVRAYGTDDLRVAGALVAETGPGGLPDLAWARRHHLAYLVRLQARLLRDRLRGDDRARTPPHP